MVGSGQEWEESIGSQCQDQLLNLERKRDREVSVHTTHTSRSQSQRGSHISHEKNTKSLQLEINRLRRRLRRERQRRTPSYFDPSSKDEEDGICTMKIVTTSGGVKVRHTKVWAMTL